MNKRGWLASGLLAAAVIGGYLGLLPLLSSLAAGPAWPDPIASRDASGVITVTAPSITEAAQGDGTTSSPEVEPVVRNDDGPTETTGGDEAIPVSVKPTRKKKVTVVVAGGLERVTPKPAIVTRPSNGGSASGGSSGGSASGGSSGGSGGSSAGGSGGGNATPTTPDLGPLDGIGPGSVAGGGQQDNGDDEASAGG